MSQHHANPSPDTGESPFEELVETPVTEDVESVVAVEPEGNVAGLSSGAEQLFRCSREQTLGKPITQLIPRFDDTHLDDLRGYRDDGSSFPLGLALSELEMDGRTLRIGRVWDRSECASREASLEHQVTHDPLTGLGNRGYLEKHGGRALADGKEAIVFLLELDQLRDVNNSLGHETGDLMLRNIGGRLKEALPDSCVLARLDGAQFVALLPATDLDQATAIAQEVTKAVRSPYEVHGLNLQAELTIGMACYPEHGTNLAALIQKGDVALYLARKTGKTIAVYQSELDLTSARHLTLKGELQRAVEEDHLVLYYQPKILASTNRITGVEALIRWNHPTQGLVFPDEFIPLAEHTGIIRSITRWVLQAAFRQCAAWMNDGIDLPISVNCSARNLVEEDLPETIERYLKDFGVPPELLTLEVTETILIEDPERALEVATLLSDLGIRISIDDFGTGYSSLNYLRRLPAKELKIDKSFVMQMDQVEGDAVIVRSIIDLAHNLGLKAIAEGVETGAVWNRLQSLGCDTGQGYFFARPLPVDVLTEWLRTSAWGLPLGVGRSTHPWRVQRAAY